MKPLLSLGEDEVDLDGTINWDMALANELETIGVSLSDDHDVGDLVNLMNQIDLYYAGDLQAACDAIRTGKLMFKPVDDWYEIRRN